MAVAERSVYKFPNHTPEEPLGHLSPSQVIEYLGCPKCYELSRIKKEPRPLGIELPVGGAVHHAVESWRRRRLEKAEPFVEDMAVLAADHFMEGLRVDPETGGEVWLDLGGYDSAGEAKDHAVSIVKTLLPLIDKLDSERGLIAAEVDISELPVENPWPFAMRGRIDALYGNSDGYIDAAADLKTSKRQEAPRFQAALQIAMYDLYVGGVKWSVDVVSKNRTPSLMTYWVGENGHFQPENHALVRELVLDVAERIQRGDFPPRPGWMCRYDHGLPVFQRSVQGFGE